MKANRLPLERVPNARDLGGIAVPSGVVRSGLLLRGGYLSDASEEDIRTLSEVYHVAKVFDFRTDGEVLHAPDCIIPGARNIHLPAIDPETEKAAEDSLPHEAFRDLGHWLPVHANDPIVQSIARRMYTDRIINEYTQIQYAAFLQLIVSTTEGAVYWHCSQGKDRTGLGGAFLLGALGAGRETIMDDFLLSAEAYEEELQRFLPTVSTPEEQAVLRTFISVNPEYFEAALDLIDRRWGSMEGYLRGPLCLTDDDFEILRNRYIE